MQSNASTLICDKWTTAIALVVWLCLILGNLPAQKADEVVVKQGNNEIRVPIELWQKFVNEIQANNQRDAVHSSSGSHDGISVEPPVGVSGGMSSGQIALISLAALLVLALTAFCLRQFVYEPWRKRKPLLSAAKIANEDQEDQFENAERWLSESLTSGLGKRDIATARFLLAYFRARLERYTQAHATLTELQNSGDNSRETTYLKMWVATQIGNHDEAELLYATNKDRLATYQQSRLIAAIALLKRAQRCWDKKETAKAVSLFRQLRELGELIEHIPEHVESHRLLMGVQELSQKNYRAARELFQAAVDNAAEGDAVTRFKGQVGELLCDWLVKVEARGELDEKIDAVISNYCDQRDAQNETLCWTACGKCNRKQKVRASSRGQRAICRLCDQAFEVKECEPIAPAENEKAPGQPDRPLFTEDDALLRDAMIWNMVSLLYLWAAQPERSSLSVNEFQRMEKRASRVLAIDDQSSHAMLIDGLTRFFFHYNDEAKRARAIELIRGSTDNGVIIAQVHNLLQNEQRNLERRQLSRERLRTKFLGWLNDPQVSEDVRWDVYEKVRDYAQQHKQQLEVDQIQPFEAANAPTTASLGVRVEVMDEHLTEFLRDNPSIAKDLEKQLNSNRQGLNEITQQLQQEARKFEEAEGELWRILAQQQFPEEVT